MNPGTAISFNGNSLQTANILTSDIDHHSSAEINAQVYNMAHANSNAIPYIDFPRKVITVTGKIISNTGLAGLDALEDTFKSYLWAPNSTLDIAYNNSTRRYTATCTKIVIKRPGELAVADFTVEFTTHPFGKDTFSTSLYASGSGTTRHNLLTNPNFETNITGWSTQSSGTGGTPTAPTISQDMTTAFSGTASLKCVTAAQTAGVTAVNGVSYTTGTLITSTNYNFSFYVKGDATSAGKVVTLQMAFTDGSSTSTTTVILTTSWQRVSLPKFTLSACTGTLSAVITGLTTTSYNFWVDAALFEQSSSTGTYFDGSNCTDTGYGSAWDGTANASTSTEYYGRTLNSYTDNVTFSGTAPYQYPVISVTYSAVTGASNGSVTIGNNANGQGITITRAWANGDVITLDTTQLLQTSSTSSPVQVNGLPVVFTGALPLFQPGSQQVAYTDNFTSRIFTYSISVTNRYF